MKKIERYHFSVIYPGHEKEHALIKYHRPGLSPWTFASAVGGTILFIVGIEQ
jgi:hypothetical protein